MFRMSGLKAQHMLAKISFVQPFRHEPAQTSLALGRMIMGIAVQGVTAKGRSSLTSDHQNEAVAACTCRLEKMRQSQPRVACTNSVQIEFRVILNLATQKALRGPSVESGEQRRLGRRNRPLRSRDRLR